MLNLTDQQEIDIINKVMEKLPDGYTIVDYNLIDQYPYKPGRPCQLIEVEVTGPAQPDKPQDKGKVYFNARKLLREARDERYDKQRTD